MGVIVTIGEVKREPRRLLAAKRYRDTRLATMPSQLSVGCTNTPTNTPWVFN